VTAAVSRRSLPQSSTGRFEVRIVEARFVAGFQLSINGRIWVSTEAVRRIRRMDRMGLEPTTSWLQTRARGTQVRQLDG
jgi:hypothetical protein